MKKTSTLGIIAIAALLTALVLTLIFGAALWDVGGNGALQGLGGWLKLPMTIFTFLGDEQFYLLLIPLVYWCLHKGLGADLGVLLVLSSFTNTALKSFFKHSRPFWEAPALQLGDASSFSTPSGHAQTSAALFSYLAWFVADKRTGTALGRPAGAADRPRCAVARLPGRPFPRRHPVGRGRGAGPGGALRLAEAEAAAAAQAVPAGHARAPGIRRGSLHVRGGQPAAGDPLRHGADVRRALHRGVACRRWRMRPRSPGWRSACGSAWRWRRTPCGSPWPVRCGSEPCATCSASSAWFAIWMGLRMIFPQEPTVLGLALRIVRYALAMLWAIAGWPWLFVKIRLAAHEGQAAAA